MNILAAHDTIATSELRQRKLGVTNTVPEEKNKERRLPDAVRHSVGGHVRGSIIIPTTETPFLQLEG